MRPVMHAALAPHPPLPAPPIHRQQPFKKFMPQEIAKAGIQRLTFALIISLGMVCHLTDVEILWHSVDRPMKICMNCNLLVFVKFLKIDKFLLF